MNQTQSVFFFFGGGGQKLRDGEIWPCGKCHKLCHQQVLPRKMHISVNLSCVTFWSQAKSGCHFFARGVVTSPFG